MPVGERCHEETVCQYHGDTVVQCSLQAASGTLLHNCSTQFSSPGVAAQENDLPPTPRESAVLMSKWASGKPRKALAYACIPLPRTPYTVFANCLFSRSCGKIDYILNMVNRQILTIPRRRCFFWMKLRRPMASPGSVPERSFDLGAEFSSLHRQLFW